MPAVLALKTLSRGICQLCLLSQLLQVELPNCLLMKSLMHVIGVGPSHQHVARLQKGNKLIPSGKQLCIYLFIFKSVASQENCSVITATCLQSTGNIAL